MKKLIIVGGVIALIALGYFIFSYIYPSADTPDSGFTELPVATDPIGANDEDAEQFVGSFYEWYLLNCAIDPLFVQIEDTRDAVLEPWLTPEFISNWSEYHLDSGVDPVLLTTDDPTSWRSSIAVVSRGGSSNSKRIYVGLGSGPSLHEYTVSIVKGRDGTWKIASVSEAI